MIQIKPIAIGYPAKEATSISIRIISFQTNAEQCSTYYQLFDENNVQLADGNYTLTNEQYESWGAYNEHVEDCVLEFLQLERL